MLPTGTGEQLLYCLRFALLGCVLGAAYDAVRAWNRVLRPGKAARGAADAVFLLLGLAAFLLLFVRGTDGRLRGYLPLGLWLGWILWQKSASSGWTQLLAWTLRRLLQLARALRRGILWLFAFPRGN